MDHWRLFSSVVIQCFSNWNATQSSRRGRRIPALPPFSPKSTSILYLISDVEHESRTLVSSYLKEEGSSLRDVITRQWERHIRGASTSDVGWEPSSAQKPLRYDLQLPGWLGEIISLINQLLPGIYDLMETIPWSKLQGKPLNPEDFFEITTNLQNPAGKFVTGNQNWSWWRIISCARFWLFGCFPTRCRPQIFHRHSRFKCG